MGFECGFPLIAFGDSDQMIHMAEVDFQVYLSLLRCIQQIRYELERVAIFFGDFIQRTDIDTKPKRTIFIFDEKTGCSVQGSQRSNEADV